MYYNLGKHKRKTVDYLAYQNDIRDSLLHDPWPFAKDPVAFHVEAGLSNKTADLDNTIKPLLDTFQVIFDDFNDNKVSYIELHKKTVNKGDEYLWIRVRRYGEGLSEGIHFREGED